MKARRMAVAAAPVAFIFSLIAVAAQAGHFISTWIGPTGNWNDPTKWDTSDYPHNNGDTYDAVISNGKVTLVFSPTINNLQLSDPSSAGVTIDGSSLLNVVNKVTWSGGVIRGLNEIRTKDEDLSGLVTLNDSARLSHSGIAKLIGDSSLLDNQSTWTFTNPTSAQFIFAGDGDFNSTADFDNFGQLIKQVGGSDGVTEMVGHLYQKGTLDVQGGTLRLKPVTTLASPESVHEGAVQVASGAVLELSGGQHQFATGASVTGSGTLRMIDGAEMELLASTVDVGTKFELILGAISGTGELNANEAITWSGGSVSGSGNVNFNYSGIESSLSGTLTIGGTCALNLDNDAKYAGDGTYIQIVTGAKLNNLVGRKLTLAGDSNIVGGTFYNYGRLVKQRGGDDGISEIRGVFHNEASGIVEVQADARLQLHSSGTHHGRFEGPGTLDFAYAIGANQHLEIDSQVEVEHVEFHSAVDVDGLYDNVHTTTIERGEARFNSVSFTDALTLTDGALGGTGTLTALGVTNWTGGTMKGDGIFQPQGGMLMNGNLTLADMRTINNTANTDFTGDGVLTSSASAEFNNQVGAQFQFLGDVDYQGGIINNYGQLLKASGAGLSEITATLNNFSSGVVEARSGTLRLKDGTHSGRFVRYLDAQLEFTGNGTFNDSDIVVFDPNSLIRGYGPNDSSDLGSTLFTDGVSLLDDGTEISGPGFARVAGGTVNVGDEGSDIVTAENFAVDSGVLGGSGTLELNGQFEFTGGTMGGDGVTNLNMNAEFSGDPILAGTRSINNEGDVIYSGDGGRLTQEFGSSPVFNNRGTFTFTGDSDYLGLVFNNEGSLIKEAGSQDGLSLMSTANNSGNVEVRSGTLSISAAGAHTGSFSGSGVLSLGGPHQLQASSSVNVSTARLEGTIDINGTYNVPHTAVEAGAANFNATATTQTLDITGGSVAGSGTLTVSGATTWTSGGMGGSGVTNAMGPINISGFVSLDGTRTLNNYVSATYSGDTGQFWNYPGTSTFHNRAGAQLTFAGDSDYRNGTIQNDGALVKQAGASDGRTLIDATLNNAGTVEVQSGTLALNKGGTHSGQFYGAGTLEFSGGTNTLLSGSQVTVDHVLLSGGTTTFDGTYDVYDTRITAYDHHFNGSAVTETMQMEGGALRGNGTLTVTGTTTWTYGWMRGGGVTQAQGDVLITDWAYLEDTRSLNNGQLTTIQGDYGGFWNGKNTTFNNLSSAELLFEGDSDYLLGTIQNQGILTKRAGSSDGVTEISATLINTGTIEVESGSLNLTGTFSQTTGTRKIDSGASLTSSSQLNVQGGVLAAGDGATIVANVSMAGVMQVGGSTGVVTLDGDYSQAFSGTLAVDLAGRTPGAYDQLNITGAATLRGTLDVSLEESGGGLFAPVAGDVFEILTTGTSMIGSFGNPPVLPSLASGLSWNINYDFSHNRVLLEVQGTTSGGDFDGDGDVDGSDFLMWQRGESPHPLSKSDLSEWQANYGAGSAAAAIATLPAVPEPTGILLLIGLMICCCADRKRVVST